MKLMILCLFCLHLALGSEIIVGGWQDVDLNKNDPTFNQAVKDIVIFLGKNSPYFVVLDKIVSAREQQVNGMNYDVTLELDLTNCMKNQNNQNPESCTVNKKQTCTVKAHKPFKGETKVNDHHCGPLEDVNQRKKRFMDGEIYPATHEEVQESLKFAIDTLNSRSNGFHIFTAQGIKKAEKQIVKGMKYYITLDINVKSCLDKVKLTDCPTNKIVEKVIECRLEVVDQPWLNPRFKLLKPGCELPFGILDDVNQRKKRSVMGGINPVDEVVKFAIDTLNSRSNGFHIFTALKIKKVETQIVKGLKYYITLDINVKSCLDKVKVNDCQTNKIVEKVIECRLEVVDQQWLNPRFTFLKHGCKLPFGIEF